MNLRLGVYHDCSDRAPALVPEAGVSAHPAPPQSREVANRLAGRLAVKFILPHLLWLRLRLWLVRKAVSFARRYRR
jgi:hypothetical protein